MTAFRTLKRRARRDLHAVLQVPALYIAELGAEPVLLHVRLHLKEGISGKMTGRAVQWMRVEDTLPEILFMRDEVASKGISIERAGIVSVEPGEAYIIERMHPIDDITVNAIVNTMREEDTVGLPVPVAEVV